MFLLVFDNSLYIEKKFTKNSLYIKNILLVFLYVLKVNFNIRVM